MPVMGKIFNNIKEIRINDFKHDVIDKEGEREREEEKE